MDQPGQYVQQPPHQRHQRFSSSQLPPPSQLLPGSSYSNRSITLPPINSLPQANSRYAPYPHHSSPVTSSHSSSQLPWQNQPIQREELVQRQPPVKQESHSIPHREAPEPGSSQQATSRHDPTEDAMSSTSDFVKKLYKYVQHPWRLTAQTERTTIFQNARRSELPGCRFVGSRRGLLRRQGHE